MITVNRSALHAAALKIRFLCGYCDLEALLQTSAAHGDPRSFPAKKSCSWMYLFAGDPETKCNKNLFWVSMRAYPDMIP